MAFKSICPTLCFLLLLHSAVAQDKSNAKFGKITPADFDLSNYKYDSGAAAVVIADVGSSSFEGNNKSFFSIIFKHYKRVKIINKNGFDVATVEIPLYAEGENTEKLQSLKAVTYNLENGKVTEAKLDPASIFTDHTNKKWVTKKFTFPAVKEGSIIEFSYTQSSDFLFNLQPWEFQGGYPRLWSEYEVSIPEYFNYVTLTQGYQPFAIKSKSSKGGHYSVQVGNATQRSETVQLDGVEYDQRFVMKNVPALKEEHFTTTLANHIAKIEFQLASISLPNQAIEVVMGDWAKLCKTLMESEKFGVDIEKNNGWLSDDLKTITAGANSQLGKARKIFSFLRDNFTCTDHSRLHMDNNLKTVFKNKSGNDAEINLLLTAMLKHEGILSAPVILSTRDHGKTNEVYPLLDRFNYVVCAAELDSSIYYLDASDPGLGFGHLPPYCYNGHARLLVNGMAQPVYFEPDSIMERKVTTVFISPSEKQKGAINGSFSSGLGYFESYLLRKKMSSKSEKGFFNDIKSGYTGDVEIMNGTIDSLKQLDNPATLRYDFEFRDLFTGDIVYFSPMLSEAYKENPFKSASREYPVEMPYASDETYVFSMEIPSDYVVDEVPKSAKVLLNGTDGFFEYLTAKDDNRVQLRCRIKLNKANFSPEDYGALRDFFAYVVKKQSEQVVFKKKK